MQAIFITLPIFIIIFFGWIFARIKIANEKWVSILNSMSYYIGLPAITIVSLWQIDFREKNIWFSVLLILAINTIFFFAILFFLKLFRTNKNLSATILLGSMIGNCIFIGMPIVEMNFGKIYLPETILMGSFMLVTSLVFVIIYIDHTRSDGKSELKKELADLLKNPLVISLILGIILSFLKLENPAMEGIKKSISMLGATASPVALFSLGIFMYGRKNKNIKLSLFISVIKMIALPVVAIIISIFVFKSSDIRVLSLISSMPVAVTTFSIAEKFGLDKEIIGSSIITSTLLVAIVAPIVILLAN